MNKRSSKKVSKARAFTDSWVLRQHGREKKQKTRSAGRAARPSAKTKTARPRKNTATKQWKQKYPRGKVAMRFSMPVDDFGVSKAGETARPTKMSYGERQTLSTDSTRALAGVPQRGIKKEHAGSVKKLGLHQTKRKDQPNHQADVNFNVSRKSFRVYSLDDYAAMMKAEGDQPPTKKHSRPKISPSARMKPVSDGEAIADLRGGSVNKARKMGKAFGITVADLNRAVGASPPPVPGSAKRPYLPGVHPTSAKPKYKDAGRLMGMPPKKAAKSVTSDKAPPAQADGGVAMLSLRDQPLSGQEIMINKSEGAAMTKTNFSDLFKSEIGIPADEALCACPHCDAPITKSDLEKAGKGAATQLSGSKGSSKKGPELVVTQNPQGGVMRGGDGKGQVASSRGVPGAQKTDAPVGVQNSKGSRGVKKSEDDEQVDDPTVHDITKKSIQQNVTIRGTEWVQYVNDGEDARIAKSISEGSAAQQPTQPIDLNSDMTRLLV